MLFINTRPIERAQALTQCLVQADFKVIDLPVLALKAKPFDSDLMKLYSSLLQTQLIVVVSPTAVDIGMRYLEQAGIELKVLKHVQWIAVGKTTAAALARLGIDSLVPEVETSEGMLSLPIFDTMNNLHTIAFWRGEGGRQFMMQQCAEKDIAVLNFVLYERYCPKETYQNFEQIADEILAESAPYWVCISSEASWKNWLKLCENNIYMLNHCHYLVLGERLYQLLNHDKNNLRAHFAVNQLDDLNPTTVLIRIHALQRKL